jgi:hypothetical protein
MIAITEDNQNIEITRGDATQKEYNVLAFKFPIYNVETQQEEDYEFKPTDKITFVCFNKKGYTKEEILRKNYLVSDLGYTQPTPIVELPLTSEDTKKFPLLNKSKTYWFDLVLNDEVTILGMDSEGARTIKVFPESGEGVM